MNCDNFFAHGVVHLITKLNHFLRIQFLTKFTLDVFDQFRASLCTLGKWHISAILVRQLRRKNLLFASNFECLGIVDNALGDDNKSLSILNYANGPGIAI